MPVRRYGPSGTGTPARSSATASLLSHHDPNAESGATPVSSAAAAGTPPRRATAASRLAPRAAQSADRSESRAEEVEVEIVMADSPIRGEHAAAPAAAHKSSGSKTLNYSTTETQQAIYDAIKCAKPLPQLQEPRRVKQFTEASLQDSLYRLVETHDVIMVAGAFFGDEGKGKTVDAVARHPKCTSIARVNSGENAGHTVYDSKGRKFVFNLAPSGLLTPNKKNYIGPECVMDPVSFLQKELQQLIDAGIDYAERLFVGNVCIVTPYHKLLDLLGSAVNASTLKGMSPVHSSKVAKRGIRLDHIFNDEATLRSRLAKDMETYLAFCKLRGLSDDDVVGRCEEENSDGVQRLPSYVIDFARAKDKVGYLVDLYRTQVRSNPNFPPRCDVIHALHAALSRGEKVLLEGPQSYWLSNAREKFWGSTTSADTSAAGLLATAQINFQRYRSVVINVHKAPGSSRVGIGACASSFVPQEYFSSQGVKTLFDLPDDSCTDFEAIQSTFFREAFPNADDPAKFNGVIRPVDFRDAAGVYNINVAMAIGSVRHHGECGAVTKKPRVCGFFDCVLHHEVNSVQGPYLSISALDRGDDYDKIGLVIAYIYYNPSGEELNLNGRAYRNGDVIHAGDPVPCEAALYFCQPVIKLVNGWKKTPIAATKRKPFTPLPQGLCEFLSAVEHFTGCKVLSIGNGPNGDNIIYLRQ
uniref:Adenylosuccinate synthetase n=1 Tax=Strigomonas oncopelti TaxID=5657 RepID=U5KL77_STROO|nr:adenylosuccinate synthase [Strigomonas oncopelti]